jgi:purine-binding chemotaxis protein CheW
MSVLTQNITRPQQALQSYLDDLLQDAFEGLEEQSLNEFEQAVREEQERDAARQPRPVAQVPTYSAPAAVAVELASVSAPLPLPEPQAVPLSAPVQSHDAEPEPEAVAEPAGAALDFSAPPAWADEPFEALLFDVAGLTLAVPLVCLGSIYPLASEQLTPLFGQPDWFLGLLPTQSGNLRVLDTARWVLADRYRDDFREGLQYVISVQGYEWGLAVHQVSRSIRLDPQSVKWRGQRSQRPWLAGTVIEHMCALLDVTALAQMIVAGETGRRVPGSA